jgi:hypothetical protein
MTLLQLAMQNPPVCGGNLARLPPIELSTKSIPIPALNYFNGPVVGNTIIQAGGIYGGITINTIELLPIQGNSDFRSEFISAGSGQILAQIHVTAQKNGTSIGGSLLTSSTDIPVSLQVVNSSGNDVILACTNLQPPGPQSGVLCGLTDYSEGGCGGTPAYEVTPCLGADPKMGCPAGHYAQQIANANCHTFYSCVSF